jgi:hypothetical protein
MCVCVYDIYSLSDQGMEFSFDNSYTQWHLSIFGVITQNTQMRFTAPKEKSSSCDRFFRFSKKNTLTGCSYIQGTQGSYMDRSNLMRSLCIAPSNDKIYFSKMIAFVLG